MKSWRLPALYLLLLSGMLIPASLHAGLFEQLAGEPSANSMGNAVTAYPEACGGLAIHYNPANLADLDGVRLDNILFYTRANRRTYFNQAIDPETGQEWAPFGGFFNNGKDPLDDTSGVQRAGYFVIPFIDYEVPYLAGPSLGLSYKPPEPGNRLTFGFAQYAPFGAGLQHSSEDPNSYLGKKGLFLRMILAAPGVAYRVTDTLAVGISVPMGVSVISLDTNMRTPNTMVALTGALGQSTEGLEIPVLSELTLPPPWFNGGMTPYNKVGSLQLIVEDYFTTSYNLGLLWEPYDWFGFGACYQSQCDTTMEGDYTFTYGSEFQRTVAWLGRSPLTNIIAAMFDLPNSAVPNQKGTAVINMTWPARLQFGIKLRPIKQLVFTCDANWTDWEAWPELKIVFDQKIQMFRFARMLGYGGGPDTMLVNLGMKNTWHMCYGLELRPVKKVALRFGYEPRPTSIQDDKFGMLPLTDMQIISGGIGITVEDQPKPKPHGMHGLLQQLQHPTAVDINVSYIKFKDKFVGYNESTNLNSTDFTGIVYNPFAGLEWRQKYKIWLFALNQVFKW